MHTGTWFMIDLLKRGDDLDGVFLWEEFQNMARRKTKPVVLHSHVLIDRPEIYDDDSIYECTYRHYFNDAMVDRYPTIVTIRDPLLAMISHKIRNSRSPKRSVPTFCYVAGMRDHPNVVFMPIDVVAGKSNRQHEVEKVLKFCGLGFNDLQREYVNRWQMRNRFKRDNLELRRAYRKRNLGLIREQLGNHYDELKAHESQLRPFLESQGYSDLLWWG